jgi:hypothetical protein
VKYLVGNPKIKSVSFQTIFLADEIGVSQSGLDKTLKALKQFNSFKREVKKMTDGNGVKTKRVMSINEDLLIKFLVDTNPKSMIIEIDNYQNLDNKDLQANLNPEFASGKEIPITVEGLINEPEEVCKDDEFGLIENLVNIFSESTSSKDEVINNVKAFILSCDDIPKFKKGALTDKVETFVMNLN